MDVSPNTRGKPGDVCALACVPPRHGSAQLAPVHLVFFVDKIAHKQMQTSLDAQIVP